MNSKCERDVRGTKKWKSARRIDSERRARVGWEARNPGSYIYTRSPREKWDRSAIAAVFGRQIEKIFIMKRPVLSAGCNEKKKKRESKSY